MRIPGYTPFLEEEERAGFVYALYRLLSTHCTNSHSSSNCCFEIRRSTMTRVSTGNQKLGELGPYILLEQLAVGGMAEIYLAKTSGVAGFEKLLCLKIIHPNYAEDEHFIGMLIDEAKIAVGLNHANIVQIFDLGRDGKTYFIAMEYIDGADLFKIMRQLSEKEIDVPIDVAVFIAQEICTGLDYAHRKRDEKGRPLNIIHRDISPQNVLLSYSGEVKIVDFGIAKATSSSRKTQAGVIKGKYYYMSPEQSWGDPVDQRTDIFSTGIILYEVLTGQMLYLEEDMHQLLDMVRKADIPRPSTRRPDLPPQLENVVMKALAKRPADRWQTAHEFQAALTNFLFSNAPAFTPNQVIKLLETALAEPTETEQKKPPPSWPNPSTHQVDSDSIMSRVDYHPQSDHSVLFRLDDLRKAAGQPSEGGDEHTMISGPPMMPASNVPSGIGLDTTLPPWEERENDPTIISRNLPLKGANLASQQPPPRSRRKSRSLPVEIVVPRASFSSDMDARNLGIPPEMQNSREPAVTPGSRKAKPSSPMMSNLPPLPPRPVSDSTGGPPPLPAQVFPGRGGPPPPPRHVLNSVKPTPSHPQYPSYPYPPDHPAFAQTASLPTPDASRPEATPLPQYPSAVQYPSYPSSIVAPADLSGPPHQQWNAPSQGQSLSARWQQQQWPHALPPQASPSGQVPYSPTPGYSSLPSGFDASQLPSASYSYARQRKRRSLLGFVILFFLVAACGVMLFFLWPPLDEEGRVSITTVPEQASIVFDGKPVEQKCCPVTISGVDVKQSHTLEVTSPTYKTYKATIAFPEGENAYDSLAVLTRIYGKLEVDSEPSGSDIYIDDDFRGKTPMTFDDLTPDGKFTLELKKPGYKNLKETITWEGQTTLTRNPTLERSR
jgi:eukaryotic-like serine/threonine-protein kinase